MKVMAECLSEFTRGDKNELLGFLMRRKHYPNPHLGLLAMIPVETMYEGWKVNMCGCDTCHRIADKLKKHL